MSDASTREDNLLIIRRGGGAEMETPKGGVWKIAYADFMTAMMAFFLVMWLINATSETTKTGVANYFNPIKLSDGMQLPKKGLNDPEDEDFEAQPAETETEAEAESESEAEATGSAHEPSKDHAAAAKEAEAHSKAEKPARFSEDALFRDPYAVLAAIAAEADGTSSLAGGGGGRSSGAFGGDDGIGSESYGDPFDPAAWYSDAPEAPAEQPISEADPGEAFAQVEALSQAHQASAQDEAAELADSAGAASPAKAAKAKAADRKDPAEHADAAKADAEAETPPLREQLAEALKASSRSMPNVTVESADGGVLISLADQVEFGMFAIGSAEPLPETIAVMEKIAGLLQELPGKVIIRGHTDGRPFKSGEYDNWRLSSARAHMAYHMLVRGGLDEMRVERIEGYADRDLKLPASPDAAENRRIDILIQKVSS